MRTTTMVKARPTTLAPTVKVGVAAAATAAAVVNDVVTGLGLADLVVGKDSARTMDHLIMDRLTTAMDLTAVGAGDEAGGVGGHGVVDAAALHSIP